MPLPYLFSDVPAIYPEQLTCERANEPLGVDNPHPRFSFVIPAAKHMRWSFIAFQLQVIDREDRIIWDTSEVHDDRTDHIIYEGKPLLPFTCYRWRVRLMGEKDVWDPWSPESRFETAMFSSQDLLARWITAPKPSWYHAGQWESGVPHQQSAAEKGLHAHGIYLSSSFTLTQDVRNVIRSRAYVSGVGTYALYLDRKRVGTHLLSPAATDYHKRVYYDVLPLETVLCQQFDLTLFLGNGRHIALYGFDKPRGFVQVLIEYEDGARQWCCSDESWMVTTGPIRENSLFNGELFDSTIAMTVRSEEMVEVVEPYPVQAAVAPPIKLDRVLDATRMWKTEEGYLYDFGQNLSGFVRVVSDGQPESTRLSLRFAELIDEEQKLNPASNRKALATDTYICNGSDIDWHPISTYHGFRYVQLSGYVGVPTIETLQALFVHTEAEPAGTFTCSHEGLNRVHEAILWGLRSNMMGIPTDSPQRDERHGWLADAMLAAPAALLNYDASRFYEKFLQDIADTQRDDGAIADVAPKFWMDKPADPAWGSAFISIAWYLYLYRGEEQVLRRHFRQMCRYIEFLLSRTEDGIVTGLGTFGDWCAPGLVTSKKTGLEFISTWYLHHDLALLEKIAQVLEETEEEKRLADSKAMVAAALMKRYWKNDHMESLPMTPWDFPDQTSQAMTLASDILGVVEGASLAAYLDTLVGATSGDHVGTGIHGTKYLLEQLTRWNHQEKAFTIAKQTSYPGWLYMLREGATTLWERWECITCEGMNSHNHIMFGSIDQWLYEQVAGIMPLQGGWSLIAFSPARFARLSSASATVKTPHGEAAIRWERTGSMVNVSVTVPQGATGLLFVPALYADQRWSHLSTGARVNSRMGRCPWSPYPLDAYGYDILAPGTYGISWDEQSKIDTVQRKKR